MTKSKNPRNITQPQPGQPQPGTSRRQVIAAGLSAAAVASVDASPARVLAEEALQRAPGATAPGAGDSTLSFTEVAHGIDGQHAVSPGHNVQVLLRWGDPITQKAPAFDPQSQTAAKQNMQFGYDNDYIAFKPLPYGSNSSERGLLCINHESARDHLMFPGFTAHKRDNGKDLADIEMAAVGHTIVEVHQTRGVWNVDLNSRYNRRFTALTEMEISGPAAGHARMCTRDDPKGRLALGTFANCAGGETPWGTVLTAEENIHFFFGGDASGTPEAANHKSMGIVPESYYSWRAHYPRFDVVAEPHEPNRFGWMVEIDPYNPRSRPAKRTAMGRFKHEGAGLVVNPDGRLVCYMGDDEINQFVYKFVSRRTVNMRDRSRNWGLLDDGTLYAARFNDDHTVDWLPLVWGPGPLTTTNGFASQADILIEARRAATVVGATPMDRPEDIEFNKVTNSVFIAITKNAPRREPNINAANPRERNRHGHIIELFPGDAGDHAATTQRWQILLLAGNPFDPQAKAQYHPGVSAGGWLSNPDNFAIDPKGRLWIGTDGANDYGFNDGLWATDVVGAGRALTRYFFRTPVGGELTGPTFTPDGTTLFVSVQHPGDLERSGSSFVNPITRWPDFKDGIPPRPSVLAIRTESGKPIG